MPGPIPVSVGLAAVLPDPSWYLDAEFSDYQTSTSVGGMVGKIRYQNRRAGAGLYVPFGRELRGVVGAGYVGLLSHETQQGLDVRSDENGFRIYAGGETSEDRLSLYANAGYVQLAHTSGPEVLVGGRFDLYQQACIYVEYRKTQYNDTSKSSVNLTPSELHAGFRLRFY
jgi:hypothetical protein